MALAAAVPAGAQSRPAEGVPSVREMIDARTDVWGLAARRHTDGPGYEFFKDLLPPLRYVNTDFRHYPIVLSAPRAPHKVRLVSNGSAINARANQPPMWFEAGVPVAFFVGEPAEPFGQDLARLEGPRYQGGYLPIVTMSYRHGACVYAQEVFAPVTAPLADHGAAMARFTLTEGPAGQVQAGLDTAEALEAGDGVLRDAQGRMVMSFEGPWEWRPQSKRLVAALTAGDHADLLVFTRPAPALPPMASRAFQPNKRLCEERWSEVLSRSVGLTTPEAIVNDAWRATLIGNLMIASGDRMNYSAGNAYAKLYEAECGDALRSLLLFGRTQDGREMLRPLLAFDRQATRFHVAGHKLQLLAFCHWLLRDPAVVADHEPLWRQALELILNGREAATGLLPKDNYAGDVPQQVYSLNSNANCWRGLRDLAAVLDDLGRAEEARRLRAVTGDYRAAILKAVERSERRDTLPPFIPVALLADEPPHDPLTATRMGSYYDLIAPYVIGSEVFGQGSQREDWLIGYLEHHGGIALGMIRTTPHQGQFKGEPGVNVLYGLRYQLALLRRDEREKALVGFYGQLAQAMTRDTYIGGEGSRFLHGDGHGRSFYLPPNSAANAMFLVTLRYLLVQDWDLDEDGAPDTLRLLYGVPRRWLADGGHIALERAPTQFGEVSLAARSALAAGHVQVRVSLAGRAPRTVLLRAPLPAGWKITDAEVNGEAAVLMGSDTVNLTGRPSPVEVRFSVARR